MNRADNQRDFRAPWRALAAAVLLMIALGSCSSDEESRQWYVNELERTNSFAADEARCYVDGVADEFGVHALNPSRAQRPLDRARIVEIQNECRNGTSGPLGFVDSASQASADDIDADTTENAAVDESAENVPVNYNRRKNVIKRLKNRLGLTTWDASCLIDSVMAETNRRVDTWAGASAELQNDVLARCLKSEHHG